MGARCPSGEAALKIDLMYELQMPRPWASATAEADCYWQAIEQITRADELGFDTAWAVEHHFQTEYAHSSAPEVFLAYVAAKTQRIRLGHGITLTPYRYNHPIRIAERIATLDILSGGRVSWGSGKSSSKTEQLAFESNIRELHEQWLEALEMIPQMWQKDVFEFKGRFFNVPPTQVIPKPVQRPHPPMFAACSKPESAVGVGKVGLGALNFAVGNDVYLAQKVADYRKAVLEARPTSYQKTNHFACTPVGMCLPDDRKACRYGMRGASFFAEALGTYYFNDARPTGYLNIPRDFLDDESLEAAMDFRGSDDAPAMNVIGDPVHCREIVSRFQSAGVDELILVMQTGTMPQELILESIRVFGEQVMPHFTSSEEAHASPLKSVV